MIHESVLFSQLTIDIDLDFKCDLRRKEIVFKTIKFLS